MASIEVPRIVCGRWQRWVDRERPSQDLDVPSAFGVLGLYLLAMAETDLAVAASADGRHLQAHVIYIGKSSHVEQRLERTHQAVRRYREKFKDDECRNLWFSLWHSEWSNRHYDSSRKAVALASIALYERALILAYVQEHGRLPALNNE